MIILLYTCIFIILLIALGVYRIHLHISYLSGQLSYRMSISPWARFFNFEFYKENAVHFFGIQLARKKIFTKRVLIDSKDRTQKKTGHPQKRSFKRGRTYKCFLKKFQHRFYPVVRNAIRSFRFRSLDLKGNMGFKTPAMTGIVFGWVQSLQYLLSEKVCIDLKPDFTQRKSEYSLNLELHCILFVLLWRIILSVLNAGWVYLKCKVYS
jgi:hypothetical protein